jgi:hypothetical protein
MLPSLSCVLLLLETMHSFIKIIQMQDIVLSDFIDVLKIVTCGFYSSYIMTHWYFHILNVS